MKVIVAGFPKTGTESMNSALTKLGYKVYDVGENLFLLGKNYEKILKEGWTTEEFRQMYEDIDAVVDAPGCFFWEEIHRAFPDAKIILTMRENEDIWFESFQNHCRVEDTSLMLRLMEFLSPSYSHIMSHLGNPMISKFMAVRMTKWRIRYRLNEAMLKLKYRAHNAHVLQNAPKDKLLVYACSEGWGPLCKFLQVPVPSEPFPRKNVRGNIVQEELDTDPIFLGFFKEMLITTVAIVATSSFGGYMLYKYGPRGIYDCTCNTLCSLWQSLF